MASIPSARFLLASKIKDKYKKDNSHANKESIVKDAVLEAYRNPREPGSYGGISTITRIVKDKLPQYTVSKVRQTAKEVLASKQAYYLNVQPKNHFLRSRVLSAGANYMFDADLMNLYQFGRYNKGYKYVLLVIDIFSRFVMVRGLKSKSHADVVPAMEEILQEKKCKILRTDAGGEFTSHQIKQLYVEYEVKHYLAYNDGKASYSERAVKTIKNKLIRYMMTNNTYKWIDVLQDVAYSYNNTVHSTLNRKPKDITEDNEDVVFQEQYNTISLRDIKDAKKRSKNIRKSLDISAGDYVRLSRVKKTFQKEYEPKWTGELFQVYKTSVRDGCIVFYVRDLMGEVVEGSFYRQQLQKALVREEDLYQYEKVLGRRTRNGKKYYHIHWAYYPAKFDEWVSEQQFRRLKKRVFM